VAIAEGVIVRLLALEPILPRLLLLTELFRSSGINRLPLWRGVVLYTLDDVHGVNEGEADVISGVRIGAGGGGAEEIATAGLTFDSPTLESEVLSFGTMVGTSWSDMVAFTATHFAIYS
jgi:hypothetical protein